MVYIIVFSFIIISLLFVFLFANFKRKKLFKMLTIANIDTLSGTDFEKIVSYIFKKHGYKTSLTPNTNDYGADVIAKKNNKTVVVQAKCYYNHLVGNAAVQEIYGAKGYYRAEVACVVTNWHYSKQATILAKQLDVVLLDRKNITEILQMLKLGKHNKTIKNIYQYSCREEA